MPQFILWRVSKYLTFSFIENFKFANFSNVLITRFKVCSLFIGSIGGYTVSILNDSSVYCLCIWAVEILKRIGLDTEPCGIPLVTIRGLLSVFLWYKLCSHSTFALWDLKGVEVFQNFSFFNLKVLNQLHHTLLRCLRILSLFCFIRKILYIAFNVCNIILSAKTLWGNQLTIR